MRRTRRFLVMAGLVMAVAGCGVPRGAGVLAQQGAGALATLPADEAGVRAALAGQAEAWGRLALMLRQRTLGGIPGVEPGFVELVEQTAALARRQEELIDAGTDDPALDRAALEKFRALWADAARYLGS